MKIHKAHILLFALLYAVTGLVAARQPFWIDAARNFVFDEFQRLDAPAYDPAGPVRVLSVDEASLKALGQWPWPRTRVAEIVERLHALGAAAIGFDVIFAEPDRTSLESVLDTLPDQGLAAELKPRLKAEDSNDARLARAIADAPVVLGAAGLDDATGGGGAPWPAKAGLVVAGDAPDEFLPRFPGVVMPIPVLREAAPGMGVTNWLPDRDQVVRRVPLLIRSGDSTIPSLALESLRLAQGAGSYVLRGSNASGFTAFGKQTGLNAIKVGDIEVLTGGDGSIRPRYTDHAPGRFIPAIDLLAGKVAPEEVAGRIILVGTPVVGLGDVRATPLRAVVPGVEIQAQVIEQLVTGQLLSRPDWALGLEIAVTLVFLTLLAFSLPRLSPLLAAALSALAILAFLAGAWIAFDRYGVLLDPAFPAMVVGTAYLAGASLLWEEGLQAERRVRGAFGKYVAPAVVARLAANPALLVLSGETRELTMLFADVRSFSTISEKLTAREVSHFLNEYLTPMTDAILATEGTIDKYIGDAIVAFWNAPLDVPDHTRRAVDAALGMRSALRAYNDRRAALPGSDNPVGRVRFGIGLNVGPCSVGNMGSLQRFDYSALGDPMNVAARLEALTKSYDIDLLATDDVVQRTADYAWLKIEAVRVKGRSAVTQLHTLIGSPELAASDAFARHRAAHEAMLADGHEKRFRQAARRARDLAEAQPDWAPLYTLLAGRYAASHDETIDDVVEELPETNLAPPSG